MSNIRVLTSSQIEEAKQLREEQGITKRDLAKKYEVAPTTLWYNIYGRKRKTRTIYIYREPRKKFDFANIQGFVTIVEQMRSEGMNSNEISITFNVPIQEVNLIWCKTL